ncbi:MAG: hypothetical protein ACTSUE_26220 [Promethearchaeota archaeon]
MASTGNNGGNGEFRAMEKQKIFNVLYVSNRTRSLQQFFNEFFDSSLKFSNKRGLFYFPFKLEPGILLKSFAVLRATLELVITPKEFDDADCIVLVLDLLDSNKFQNFVPFLKAILEKKKSCPPILIVGMINDEYKTREVSYFGMIALKSFITSKFQPLDAHYIEWNIKGGFDGRGAIRDVFSRMVFPIEKFKRGEGRKLSKVKINSDLKKLIKEMQDFKFLDKKQGIKYLILDEAYRRFTRKYANQSFHGYTRTHLISRGLNPEFVKDIIDEWENPAMKGRLDEDAFKGIMDAYPGLNDSLNRYYKPVSLHDLLHEYKMSLELGYKIIEYLNSKNIDADFHDTQFVVEELMGLMEIFVLYEGQPIFTHLPNVSHGVGSAENISLISGMVQVLDILRNQVFTSELDEIKVVEKIKYGSLNLGIAHGKKVKLVVHSIKELSEGMLERLERYIMDFEAEHQAEISSFKGDIDSFTTGGIHLYRDIFTPLPLELINRKFHLVKRDDTSLASFTRREILVYNEIAELQEQNQIGKEFEIEDIFPIISKRTSISLSDLLLILPGDLVKME